MDILILFLLLLVAYSLPTIVAVNRRVGPQAGIAILNIALGWTVLGWLGALIWAVSAKSRITPEDEEASARAWTERLGKRDGYDESGPASGRPDSVSE